MLSPQNPILHANHPCTIFLLDIPTSIASAQYSSSQPSNHANDSNHPVRTLLSCPALAQPYPSTEPRTPKARHNVLNRQGLSGADHALNNGIVELAESALGEVKGAFRGKFCLPRVVGEELVGGKRKRGHDEGADGYADGGEAGVDRLLEKLASMRLEADSESVTWRMHPCAPSPEPTNAGGQEYTHPAKAQSTGSPSPHPWTGFIANPTNSQHTLSVTQSQRTPEDSTATHYFLIPPHSAFLHKHLTPDNLSDLKTAAERYFPLLRSHISNPLSPTRAANDTFDLILLDPPWPNRSARRRQPYSSPADTPSHLKSNDLPSLLYLLRSLPLPSLTSPSGYIAIWLTNSPTIRSAVLGPGGLFEAWGLQLAEEWVWVKVTENGEPVSADGFRGTWRKGWECLAIGRRGGVAGHGQRREAGGPKRRAILAVPDLHSRKPCLKRLFEGLLFPEFDPRPRALENPRSPAVVELFARHLTAGWLSVGNECLKYAWDRRWALSPFYSPPPVNVLAPALCEYNV